MKIYTSYYARVKDLPKGLVPISISRITPYYVEVRGREPDLAPSNFLFKGYHEGTIDTQAYERIFNQGLSTLDVDFKAETLQRMAELCGGRHAVLLCYEKPEDFCHRHLVAQ